MTKKETLQQVVRISQELADHISDRATQLDDLDGQLGAGGDDSPVGDDLYDAIQSLWQAARELRTLANSSKTMIQKGEV